MAVRDVRRHPWQTLLILALIGLPVFALTAGSILMASVSMPSETEQRERHLWGFDGTITEAGFPKGNLQSPTDPQLSISEKDNETNGYEIDVAGLDAEAAEWNVCPGGEECSVDEAIPSGTEATMVRAADGEVAVPGSQLDIQVVIADVHRDDLRGDGHRFELLDGALPGPQQALASGALLEELAAANERAEARGLEPASLDSVTLNLPDGGTVALPISGTLLDRQAQWPSPVDLVRPLQGGLSTVFVPAGSPTAEAFAAEGSVTVYLNGEVPDDYSAYRAYNQADFAVLFAPVMDGSGPVQDAFDDLWGSGTPWMSMVPLLFIGVLALAETGLLAGAAFAVGVRQQRRATALLSVTGAEPATLRQTMVFSGLWCGLLGSLAGAVLGVGTAWGLLWSAEARHVVVFGPHVPWWLVLTAVLLGLICAVVAAWVPTRSVSRQDAWAAMKGVAGERRPVSRRMLTAGLIVAGVGLLVFLGASGYGMAVPTIGALFDALPVLVVLLGFSSLLLLAGVLMLLPGIVAGWARLSSRLPVSLRIAARDAYRNRSRTVPVAAAVVAATAVGAAAIVGLGLGTADQGDHARAGSPTEDTGYLGVRDEAGIQRVLAQEALWSENDETPTVDDLQLFTGGASGAVDELQSLSTVPGTPQLMDHWQVYSPRSSCEFDYSADCSELIPLYPEDSVCHVPIPQAPTVSERSEAVYQAIRSMSRAASQSCGISGPSQPNSLNPDPMMSVMVVDPLRPETVPAPLFGGDDELVSAVQSGQAVVFDPEYVDEDGQLTLGEFTMDVGEVPGLSLNPDLPGGPGQPVLPESAPESYEPGISAVVGRNVMWAPEHEVTVDAVVAPELEGDEPIAVIPVTALAGMDQSMALDGVLARFAEPVSDEQLTLTNDVLQGQDLWLSSMTSSDGFRMAGLWGLTALTAVLVITVAGMTTGLALADARRDQTVLSSIGANPGTRKNMAAAQTFTGALTGTVLGVPVGALPVMGFGLLQLYTVDWIPWLPLLTLIIGGPLLAAALTWMVVPGRLPMREADRD
ncbi:FtsX-like permease family protein [Citricoccus sp. GCM10030269]|uniref:FtsX-like permease family protein n=1 Tax=Citricoccus sp. GCM10030269 TaxID=3273388 RepID=UPI00360E3BB9